MTNKIKNVVCRMNSKLQKIYYATLDVGITHLD